MSLPPGAEAQPLRAQPRGAAATHWHAALGSQTGARITRGTGSMGYLTLVDTPRRRRGRAGGARLDGHDKPRSERGARPRHPVRRLDAPYLCAPPSPPRVVKSPSSGAATCRRKRASALRSSSPSSATCAPHRAPRTAPRAKPRGAARSAASSQCDSTRGCRAEARTLSLLPTRRRRRERPTARTRAVYRS